MLVRAFPPDVCALGTLSPYLLRVTLPAACPLQPQPLPQMASTGVPLGQSP